MKCVNKRVQRQQGLFYYNLIEPMVKASQNMSDEQIEEELRKQFKMRGLILADVDIIRKMDKNLILVLLT